MLVEFEYLKALVVNPGSIPRDKWGRVAEIADTVFVVDSEDYSRWCGWAKERGAEVLTWNGRKEHYVNPVVGLIKEALDIADAHPFEAVYVTPFPGDIGAALRTRVGTLLVDAPVLGSALPDLFVSGLDEVEEVLNEVQAGVLAGYFSELAAMAGTGRERSSDSLMFFSSDIPGFPELEGQAELFVLGRYFPTLEARHEKHPLSKRLTRFKKWPDPVLASLLNIVVDAIGGDEGIDVITRVPPRPTAERPDVLGSTITDVCGRRGLSRKLNLEALVCVRDYPSQKTAGSFSRRRENVRGCFDARHIPRGCEVLLIDDIATSAATIAECASTLLKAGAGKVTAVTLAYNEHRLNSYGSPPPPACSKCGSPRSIRINRYNGRAFWGCPGYERCGDEGLALDDGLRDWNSRNTRDRIRVFEDIEF